MAIVKQEIPDSPGNYRKITSHCNFKLRCSERSLHLLVLIWCYLRSLSASSDLRWWKMTVIKQGMSNWPGNGRKVTSHNNFKLRFSERSLDVVRGFLFQFGLIWKVWLPEVIIYLKIGILKEGTPHWLSNDGKMTSHSKVKVRFPKRSLDVTRGF